MIVEQRIRHIGAPIRLARVLALAARRFRRCTVLAEPRLVPLFRRTFPALDVRDVNGDDGSAAAGADFVASYETLTHLLMPDRHSMRDAFVPLQVDRATSGALRRAYPAADREVIGICWASTNGHKDLPALEDWPALLGRVNATYVSLQYGERTADARALDDAARGNFIANTGPDPVLDLDWHAAHIASVDRVVTISNTTAHLAGAIGVSTSVLLDDRDHLIWPADVTRTPWYPHTTLVRKRGRSWKDVLGSLPG